MATAAPAKARKTDTTSVRRAYKFRLYPTSRQERTLYSWLESLCRLYNLELEIRDRAFKEEGKTLTWQGHFSKWLTSYRKADPWLSRINCQTCHQVGKRLELAFQAFFRRVEEVKRGSLPPGEEGYPQPRKRLDYNSIDFPADQGQVSVGDSRVRLPMIGWVKMLAHRPMEGRLKHVVVKVETGRWYVVFSRDLGEHATPPNAKPRVGLALGSGLSLGTSCRERGLSVVRLPDSIMQGHADKDRISQRIDSSLARHNNRRRLKKQRSRLEHAIANRRRDWQHKTALALVERFGAIYYSKFTVTPKEDRKETDGSNDGKKGRARRREAANAAWFAFLEILKYKAGERGVALVEVEPSTFDSEDSIPLNLHDRARLVLARGVAARAGSRDRVKSSRPTRSRTVSCAGGDRERRGAPKKTGPARCSKDGTNPGVAR